MDLLLGDNMGLEQDQVTIHMEVGAPEIRVEDQQRSLEFRIKVIDQFQIT
jgi:hypothetical protein